MNHRAGGVGASPLLFFVVMETSSGVKSHILCYSPCGETLPQSFPASDSVVQSSLHSLTCTYLTFNSPLKTVASFLKAPCHHEAPLLCTFLEIEGLQMPFFSINDSITPLQMPTMQIRFRHQREGGEKQINPGRTSARTAGTLL